MRRGGIPIIGNGAIPGSKGHIFVPGGNYPPGGVGQQSLLDCQFDSVNRYDDLIQYLKSKTGELPQLGWVGGDGNVPRHWLKNPNSSTILSVTGSPVTGESPWRDSALIDVERELYPSGAYRSVSTSIDPAAGEDAIWIGCAMWADYSPLTKAIGGTWATDTPSRGITLYTSTNSRLTLEVDGDTSLILQSSNFVIAPGSIFVYVVVVDRDSNVDLWINGNSVVTPTATPAGALGVGAGVAIASTAIGTLQWIDGGVDCSIWYTGSSIADAYLADSGALIKEATNRISGLFPRMGDRVSYSRNSTRIYYPSGPAESAHIMSPELAPTGNEEGHGSDEQIVSVTDKNYGFVSADLTPLNNRIDAGLVGTLQVETGSNLAALRAQLPWASGVVYDIDNPTGGTLYARFGNQVGVTSTCWLSIRARVISGAINLGFIGGPSSWLQVLAGISSNYVRNYGTANPLVTAARCALEIPSGGRVRVVLWCAGVGARVPDEVPSQSIFGVSSTVIQGILTTQYSPVDLEESYDLVCTPRLWGAASAGDSGDIVSRSGGAAGIIAVTAGGNVTTTDGTSTPSAAMSETDGSQETLRSTHGSGRLYVTQSDQTPAEAAYDGSLAASGTLIHKGSCRSVQRLLVKRNLEAGNHP